MKLPGHLVKVLCCLLWLGAGVAFGASAVSAGDAESKDSAALAAVRHRAELRGYRVIDLRWDPILRQRWVVLENAQHPERPHLAELTGLQESDAKGMAGAAVQPSLATAKLAAPVVHAGDTVLLWSLEKDLRVQLNAVAEGSGAVGERVPLRVLGMGQSGDPSWRLVGIVRGPADVEMAQ
jgi:hypothetical protein